MITRRLAGWLLTLALIAGVSIGILRPPPPPSHISEDGSMWAIPPVSDLQRHVIQDMDSTSRGMQWGAGQTPESTSDNVNVRWRLAGIINEQTPLILVMTPDQPGQAQRIQIGESLPDGAVLDAVENDQALIRSGECITTWHLFHPQPIATSDACEQAETPPQGTSS